MGNTQSYADYLSPRMLRIVIMLGYMTFYGSNCLFHPIRSAKVFWKAVHNDTSTKLTMALAQKRHKRRIAKTIKSAESGTATVPSLAPQGQRDPEPTGHARAS